MPNIQPHFGQPGTLGQQGQQGNRNNYTAYSPQASHHEGSSGPGNQNNGLGSAGIGPASMNAAGSSLPSQNYSNTHRSYQAASRHINDQAMPTPPPTTPPHSSTGIASFGPQASQDQPGREALQSTPLAKEGYPGPRHTRLSLYKEAVVPVNSFAGPRSQCR